MIPISQHPIIKKLMPVVVALFTMTLVFAGFFILIEVEDRALWNAMNNSTVENLTPLYILNDWSESCPGYHIGCGSHKYLVVAKNEDTNLTQRYVFVRGWEVDAVGPINLNTTTPYCVWHFSEAYPTVWSKVPREDWVASHKT